MSTPPKNDAVPSDNGARQNDPNAQNYTPHDEIRRFLTAMFGPGDVFEVRAPNCLEKVGSTFTSTVLGYFTYERIDEAAGAIAALDATGRAPAIYVTLNPVKGHLLGRANHRLKSKAKEATSAGDIPKRRKLLLDFDSVRPTGVSATASELAAAEGKAREATAFLKSRGWPDPIALESGNGHHRVYAIDLPTEDSGLVQQVLQALAARFSDAAVTIDCSVHDPGRITKIAGTMARKGDHLVDVPGVEDRPHRRARLLHVPEVLTPVPIGLLEALAAEAKPEQPKAAPKANPRPQASSGTAFDRFDHTADGVAGYLQRHGVTVKSQKRDGSAVFLYLDRCPVVAGCAAENSSDIAVIVGDDGKIAYKNLHNRGEGLTWLDVREALEPGYKAWAQGARERAASPGPQRPAPEDGASAAWGPPVPLHERACPFPLAEAFPPGTEPFRDYFHAIAAAYQVPVDLPALLGLAVVGLVLSHVVEVRLGPDWTQPPNHYIAVLMEPGNRKSPPFKELVGPVEAFEEEEAVRLAPIIAEHNARLDMMKRKLERLKDLASGKSPPRRNSGEPTGREAEKAAIALQQELEKEKPMSAPQLIANDITTEEMARVLEANGERVGGLSDEGEIIEVFMGRYDGRPNIELYNKGYDGSSHRANRVGRGKVRLKHPLITLGLVIQPEAVREMMENRKAKGTGFVSRNAMALPTSLQGKRKLVKKPIPADLRAAWGRAIRRLLDEKRGPIEVPLSAEAQAAFDAFCMAVEPGLSWCGEFETYGLRDWGGKLCGRIGRIALCLHGMKFALGQIRSLDEPISKETMVAAIAWAPYLIDHAKAVAGYLGIDPAAVGALRIQAWLARHEDITEFSEQEAFSAVRNKDIVLAEDLDRPIQLLLDLGYVRPVPEEVKNGAGRKPSRRYLVNPLWDRGSP